MCPAPARQRWEGRWAKIKAKKSVSDSGLANVIFVHNCAENQIRELEYKTLLRLLLLSLWFCHVLGFGLQIELQFV